MSNQPYVYTTGMNNAAEFIASGWPFAKIVAAGDVVDFPWVTNEIYVTNTGGTTVYIGFTAAGVTGSNRIPVAANTSATFRFKVAKLYTAGSGNIAIAASLTNVVPAQYPTLVPDGMVIHDLDNDMLVKKYPGV